MATKNHDPCLDKCGDDEPIFVLRAQDFTAPMAVRFWLDNAKEQGAEPTRKLPD